MPRSGHLRKSHKARARRQLQRPLDDACIVPRAVYDVAAQTTRGWNASAVDAPKISVENPWDQDTTLVVSGTVINSGEAEQAVPAVS